MNAFRRSRLYVFTIVVILFACSEKRSTLLTQIKSLQNSGEFSKSETLITDYLTNNPDIDQSFRKKLLFEIERGNRIKRDYRLSREELAASLSKRLTDFSQEEFNQWVSEGRFDILVVNGEEKFANPSVSNLFFRYPELKKRLKNYNPKSQQAQLTCRQAEQLKKMHPDHPDPIKLPRYCDVRQMLEVKKGTVPAGEIVSCWLPYPSVFYTQGNVQYRTSNSTPLWFADPTGPIRSVYFEAVMPEDMPLKFEIEYFYTAYAYYQEIDPQKVEEFSGTELEYQYYTREEVPHEVFTPKMRQLVAEIIGSEKNPYLRGKKIYEWISDNIKYSYAREYSTLRNISEYCLDNRYGDCGQEAILFITLCRIAGVPARWQSGFMTFPEDEGMHDWAEIFIKPYGWLPVDPYMGIFFTSMTEDLSSQQRRKMREFYYGNIDNYRLVPNKGHNQALYPLKKHFRSESVDFQRGETEWSGGNLYFNDWRWGIWVNEIRTAD